MFIGWKRATSKPATKIDWYLKNNEKGVFESGDYYKLRENLPEEN